MTTMYKLTMLMGDQWVGPWDLTTGSDRLDYHPPYPYVYDKTVGYVNAGTLPRYWGPLDSCVKNPDTGVSTVVWAFYTEAAAIDFRDWTSSNPLALSLIECQGPVAVESLGYPPPPTP